MIDFYHEQNSDEPTKVCTDGSEVEIVSDLAFCVAVLYAQTKRMDPGAAERLRWAIQDVFSDISPIWQFEFDQSLIRGSGTVTTIDMNELRHQMKEGDE